MSVSNFIPQMKPWFDEREKQALSQYMDSGGWLTEFRKTREFASMIAEYTGSRYCSILSNGTVTMIASLIALGIGKGDEVIVPDYTMIATANAVLMAGSTPVFADVERETICLDFESMKSKVTRRTKAIMLVSINGRYPNRLEEILKFCQQRNIKVIEDAAQSLGSFYKGKHVGTYGDVGSFSFSMPKIITTGQGGALISNDEELYHKIELVKNFGRKKAGIDKHVFFGLNFKFTDLQAVVGIEQIKKLSERIALKKRNYRLFRDKLADIPGIKCIETSNEVSPWFNDIIVEQREELQEYLKEKNIGSRPFYPAIHTQAPYYLKNESYPNAEYFTKYGLWLPSYPQLTVQEINKVTTTIRSFYQI